VSGIEAGYKARKRKGKVPAAKDVKFVGFGGDGATTDIGLQALSGAMERGHDFLYCCFDNEAYMNTGIQRSSSTPYGAWTSTAPVGKKSIGQMTWKKNMPEIVVAHRIPYVATASPSYPFDLMAKVKRGLETKGPAYIQILSVCPTGWRCTPDLSIELGRLAEETGVFPLYEVINGEYRLTHDLPKLKPIKEYLKLQGNRANTNESGRGLHETESESGGEMRYGNRNSQSGIRPVTDFFRARFFGFET
jgi:pyruvate ferredoxin oxidoreductase beta subunit